MASFFGEQSAPASQGGITGLITAITALLTALALAVPAFIHVFEKIRRLKADLTKTNSAIARVAEAPNSPDTIAAVQKLGMPAPERVGEWATKHHAMNAWDMGQKNWERCLFDLGFEGGKKNELKHDENGRLIYQ
jgi:hypothetical protein